MPRRRIFLMLPTTMIRMPRARVRFQCPKPTVSIFDKAGLNGLGPEKNDIQWHLERLLRVDIEYSIQWARLVSHAYFVQYETSSGMETIWAIFTETWPLIGGNLSIKHSIRTQSVLRTP